MLPLAYDSEFNKHLLSTHIPEINPLILATRGDMRINIHRCRDEDKRKLIRDCGHYFGEYLMGTRLSRSVSVNVRMSDLPKTQYALTTWLDSNIMPRNFEIEFNDNIVSPSKIIKVMAHEMVHVKQFAKGELVDHTKASSSRWMGQVYDTNDEVDSLLPWSAPWEVEAYGREHELFYAYRDHIRDLKADAKALAKKNR